MPEVMFENIPEVMCETSGADTSDFWKALGYDCFADDKHHCIGFGPSRPKSIPQWTSERMKLTPLQKISHKKHRRWDEGCNLVKILP